MKTQTVKLSYAHCTKWTTGKLDVQPWSSYELRDQDVELTKIRSMEYDECEYLVDWRGTRIGWGYSAYEALGAAEYWLMDHFRRMAMETSAHPR